VTKQQALLTQKSLSASRYDIVCLLDLSHRFCGELAAMDIKRFLAMTLIVIGAGVVIGIGGLVIFSIIMAALVVGTIGLGVSMLLMTREARGAWLTRVKENIVRVWRNNRHRATHLYQHKKSDR
jgi:hypothetical protein